MTPIPYRKSSYSGGDSGACIELSRPDTTTICMRDSKDCDGPEISFSREAIAGLTEEIKSGKLDHLI